MPGIGIGVASIFGGIAAAAPVSTPITILGSGSVLQWCSADLGVTQSGGTVSQWDDQSANGFHYTEATNKPTYQATGLNNLPTLLFDGTNDKLSNASFNPPAPGTTPLWIRMIAKMITWTNGDRIVAYGSTGGPNIADAGASPNLFAQNGINGPQIAAALGTWFRIECLFSNSTSDYLKVGASSVTGTNVGNTANSGGRILGGLSASGFGNFEIAEILYANRNPSGAEKTALDALTTSKWGASVQL